MKFVYNVWAYNSELHLFITCVQRQVSKGAPYAILKNVVEHVFLHKISEQITLLQALPIQFCQLNITQYTSEISNHFSNG